MKKQELLQSLERKIKYRLTVHRKKLKLIQSGCADTSLYNPKELIRINHSAQSKAKVEKFAAFITTKTSKLLPYFASGKDVVPDKISPRFEVVESGTLGSDLFRFASLTWSIPVSEGYGRRMRFLIWDNANNKIIGLLALGDPVFNLRVRDNLIGWNAEDRKQRLVNMMDAYVLGAVPPYNMLLGGKLIACLIRTQEIRTLFHAKYKNETGVISGKMKNPSLVMVTTSSALGRSSLYNRLRLNGVRYFESIGFTSGWGHFHFEADTFELMRQYLALKNHEYSSNNRFGNGPNWKFRAIRETLKSLGRDTSLLQHGIHREVFVCRLANNAERFLRGELKRANFSNVLTVKEVSEQALNRWIIPRAIRMSDYKHWQREGLLEIITKPIKKY